MTLRTATEVHSDTLVAELKDMLACDEIAAGHVYVHGFNVTFDQAVLRRHEWRTTSPSTARRSFSAGHRAPKIMGSVQDQADVEAARPHFAEFLLLLQKLDAEVHLIAHRLGCRLRRGRARRLQLTSWRRVAKFIQNLVLVAPDVDRDVFMMHAKAVTDAAHRTTIYISRNDMSLRASRAITGSPRVGDAEGRECSVPGIDIVGRVGQRRFHPRHALCQRRVRGLVPVDFPEPRSAGRYGLEPVDAGAVRCSATTTVGTTRPLEANVIDDSEDVSCA